MLLGATVEGKERFGRPGEPGTKNPNKDQLSTYYVGETVGGFHYELPCLIFRALL